MLPAFTVITSLIPVIQAAVDTIQSFSGDDPQSDSTLQNAVEVLGQVFPLIETFANGDEITQDDAREALAGYDTALSDFDAEILKQEQGG